MVLTLAIMIKPLSAALCAPAVTQTAFLTQTLSIRMKEK